MDIDEMIEQLLGMDIVGDSNTVTFSDEAKQLLHKIAEKCQNISVVEETRDQAEKYAEEMSAGEVYVDMLHKIVAAPTRIHMLMAAHLLIPVIDRKLGEEGLDGRKESNIH